MKGKHCIFLLLILVALMSCNDPKPITDTLHRAEALMNESPDSAWTLLNTISPDEMGQNRNRAFYALLYTQAQDKTYRDETNDSLISIAVDYYRNTDDVRRKFLSYYYKGRVHFNGKDYLNATTCYMEAEQLADEVGDDYLAGLLYSELGRIYDIYYDYPKSLDAHRKSAECYERAGKIRHRNYIWYNQSNVCRNMDQYDESERLLRVSLESAKQEEDESLIKLCLSSLVMQNVEQGKMLVAKGLYQELEPLVDEDYGSASYMGTLARIYMSDQDSSLAKKYLEKGWKRAKTRTDSINLYLDTFIILHAFGDEELACQELMKGVVLQNQEARQALQQPVLTAQRDYLSERLEFEAYKLRMRKLLNLVSILFFLLLLGVIVYVFVWLFRKHKNESQQVISDLENRNNRIEDEKGKIALALQQLDEDKRNADRTIAKLKEEIEKKKKEGNEKIADLKTKLQQKQQSVEDLMQTLSDVIAQKEEDRQSMENLVQQLEKDSAVNAESMLCLRLNLESQEKEYSLYVQKAEAEAKAFQDEKRKVMLQKVELLKNVLEHVAGMVFLHEAKYPKEETKEKRIKEGISLLRKNYFAGDNEYQKVEVLVNLYLDNVMCHFRKEVSLTSESEYRRVCYMFAGISGQIIGEIMQESKDVVYQRRSRLLKKIGSLSCKHKEMFMILLSK